MASIIGVETLQHTNGTTAATIDSSGRILTPARPAFHAYGTTASWTIFSNGAFTKLVLSAAAINTGTYYDTSASKFVAPVAGIYHFYYKVYGRIQSGGGASTYWMTRFQKNNAAITGYGVVATGYQYTVGGTDEVAVDSINISLAANDEITVHAQAGGSSNGEYYPPDSTFGGHLIG